MLAEVKDMPSVKEMLSTAQKILGIWDLLKFLTTGLVSHGDITMRDKTENYHRENYVITVNML